MGVNLSSIIQVMLIGEIIAMATTTIFAGLAMLGVLPYTPLWVQTVMRLVMFFVTWLTTLILDHRLQEIETTLNDLHNELLELNA